MKAELLNDKAGRNVLRIEFEDRPIMASTFPDPLVTVDFGWGGDPENNKFDVLAITFVGPRADYIQAILNQGGET